MCSPHSSVRRCMIVLAAIMAAVLVTSCTTAPVVAGGALFERITLAPPGDAGTHTYRIPALAVAKDGTLLASYDARIDSARDLPGNIDIMLRRSHDNGRTWSAPQRVVHYGDGIGSGDSSLLVDRDTGRVFLFYAYAPRGIGFAASQAGNAPDSSTTLHPRYVWSDDNGATWQGPRDLINVIKQAPWRGMFAASGHGLQLFADRSSRGRLIQPYVFRDADHLNHAVDAYSDDHGATWKTGVPIGSNLDESKAVELADGTVLQNLRSSDRNVHTRMLAHSRDGGAHFDRAMPEPRLPDPQNNADIIRVAPEAPTDQARAHWLLFSNTADPNERRNLVVRLSCNDGRTWSSGRTLDAGDAMYSVMAHLPDGSFGIFYEDGSNQLVFARFNLAWLDQPCPQPPASGVTG